MHLAIEEEGVGAKSQSCACFSFLISCLCGDGTGGWICGFYLSPPLFCVIVVVSSLCSFFVKSCTTRAATKGARRLSTATMTCTFPSANCGICGPDRKCTTGPWNRRVNGWHISYNFHNTSRISSITASMAQRYRGKNIHFSKQKNTILMCINHQHFGFNPQFGREQCPVHWIRAWYQGSDSQAEDCCQSYGCCSIRTAEGGL